MNILIRLWNIAKFIVIILYKNRNKIYFSFGCWFLFKFEKHVFDSLIALIPMFFINAGYIIKVYLLEKDTMQYIIPAICSSPFIIAFITKIMKKLFKE